VTSPLELDFEVRCSAEHAFTVWTVKLAHWWPPDHTVSGDPADIVLEGRIGGRIFERTATGVVHEWGEITAWEPPRRLGYQWFLRQDRADASQVEIVFEPVDAHTTRILIVHSGWQRLGTGPDRRATNEVGWRGVLPHFVAACNEEGENHG
jgi:uncharacterized protein YndB with AHSA1/START domain